MADLGGALTRLRLPGRFEIVPGAPRIVLDSAHTPGSLHVTTDEAQKIARRDRLVILFGLARDKDAAACIEAVRRPGAAMIFTPYDSSRSASPGDLLAAAGGEGRTVTSLSDGLFLARRMAGPEGLVLVTGSFYSTGEARALLLREGAVED